MEKNQLVIKPTIARKLLKDGYKIIDSFCRYDNKFLAVMKEYSLIIYILLAITGIYYYYYTYTAGLLITGLTKLFSLILGF